MRSAAAVLSGLCVLSGAASARVFEVGEAAALAAALEDAQAGDRILLSSGDHGDLALAGRRFDPPLEIAGGEGGGARLGSIRLDGAAGIHFRNLAVVSGAVAGPKAEAAVRLTRTAGIRFDGVAFQGAADGDPGNDPVAILARDCRDLHVANARFSDLWRGAAIFDCEDWSVRDSEFRRMASDGIVARGAVRATIEGNLFTDFAADLAAGAHPDAIQVWDRLATRATKGLVIRGNAVVKGDGGPAQGVFLFGEDPALAAEEVLVEDNLVIQSMGIGIGLRNVAGALVRRNTVVPADPASDRPGIEVRAPAAGVVIAENAAARLSAGPAAARGNLLVDYDHPQADGYAERLFADPRSGAPEGFAPLGRAGARAPASRFIPAPDAAIRSEADPFDPQRLSFRVAGPERIARWRILAPGSLAYEEAGAAAQFACAFGRPGLAVVEARWREEGRAMAATKTVRVFPRTLLAADFADLEKGADGVATLPAAPAWTGATVLKVMVEAAPDPRARRLGDVVAAPGVWRLRLSVAKVFATLIAADGAQTALSAALPASARPGLRRIALTYDGVRGRAALAVDGAEIAAAAVGEGPLRALKSAPLHIGGAPGGAVFSGEIGRIEISGALTPSSSRSSLDE